MVIEIAKIVTAPNLLNLDFRKNILPQAFQSFSASSAKMSRISSGKNSFALSTRRPPRECGKFLWSQSAQAVSNVVSAVPQTIPAGQGIPVEQTRSPEE